jgi:lipoprotein-releasing system permease protein
MQFLGFERQVAIRFLREGRMQTLLIMVGVAAGVAVITYISALISGLQRNTLEKTLGAQPHVSISAPDDVVNAPLNLDRGTVMSELQPRAQRPRTVVNWQALVPLLEAIPQVAAVSPMVSGAGHGCGPGPLRPHHRVEKKNRGRSSAFATR